MKQLNLFSDRALTWEEQLELTSSSLNVHGEDYKRWIFCFSGGKDSTATVTMADHLFKTGKVKRPEEVHCIYVDTRQELLPLQKSAFLILEKLATNGWKTHVAMPEIDKRFLVYILGTGVPPPNNATFRWCTGKLKLEPIKQVLENLKIDKEKSLMVTGIRMGESAVRDRRILYSCSKDSGECGQGWFQKMGNDSEEYDTLAPILTWRVCQVWEWLLLADIEHGYPTSLLAEVYGGEDAAEKDARTGCVGCPLATRDTALENLIKLPQWQYLAPLLELKPIYKELRRFDNRLQKIEPEILKDGSIGKNPGRKGPLTLDARREALVKVLAIQKKINDAAKREGRDRIEILTLEEEARIRELIANNAWPKGWNGTEPVGDKLFGQHYQDGSYQPTIFEKV